ncbi:MAG: bifunctional phosphopantothenoylcysteine decarboxylase/phosphopantothenate--cysteine ligase CoaBC, partial [Vampirovibrionales bacterium]|nr:bifunctional phosphopantothenoylcysteine decarboxylase/phosphopantothenate--cysteine ligase CoaBC [Vampirovibrionales bacterium]
MSLAGKTIALGITGGVAAYRACDLIRELYRRGVARVLVCMTPEASAFITPLTLESLSGYPVWQSVTSVPAWPFLSGISKPLSVPGHIWLAQQADALVILPATANIMAKLAYGQADCPISLTAVTMTGKPILVMPAMNTRMWLNPATKRNVKLLQDTLDVTIIPPSDGLLACGETGAGHLAPDAFLMSYLERALYEAPGALHGVRALVTAGGTQEPLDAVRVLTNRSSGKMGLAMADALFAAGASVTLLTSQTPIPIRPYQLTAFKTSRELA